MEHKCNQMSDRLQIIYNETYNVFFLEEYRQDHDCWGRDDSGYRTLCKVSYCPYCGEKLHKEE